MQQVKTSIVYNTVINEVIENMRLFFVKDGVEEQVLQQLKNTWKRKLAESGCLDFDNESSQNTNSPSTSSKPIAVASACSPNKEVKHVLKERNIIEQLDGHIDSTSEDDNSSESQESNVVQNKDNDSDIEEDPLDSNDDLTDDDEIFTTDNIIVCQFEKIVRKSNKWKMQLKNGIMNLNGKDYIFKNVVGEATW